MINAAMARSYAYKSVCMTCTQDALDSLYNAIDAMIETAAKDGKMSVGFSVKYTAKRYMKVELSKGQLETLADRIKTKYKSNGFDVTTVTYSYCRDDISVEIGWLSL